MINFLNCLNPSWNKPILGEINIDRIPSYIGGIIFHIIYNIFDIIDEKFEFDINSNFNEGSEIEINSNKIIPKPAGGVFPKPAASTYQQKYI